MTRFSFNSRESRIEELKSELVFFLKNAADEDFWGVWIPLFGIQGLWKADFWLSTRRARVWTRRVAACGRFLWEGRRVLWIGGQGPRNPRGEPSFP